MERRGFLKRLGFGAVAAPVIVKSFPLDEKAKKFREYNPPSSLPKDESFGSGSSIASFVCMATFGHNGESFIKNLDTGEIRRISDGKIFNNNAKWRQ